MLAAGLWRVRAYAQAGLSPFLLIDVISTKILCAARNSKTILYYVEIGEHVTYCTSPTTVTQTDLIYDILVQQNFNG